MPIMPKLPVPPAYQPGVWQFDVEPSSSYRGTNFDFGVVNSYLQAHSANLGWARICGKLVRVLNPQFTGDVEEGSPIYFELPGRNAHYVVSLWRDYVVIELRDHPSNDNGVRQLWHPWTEQQLERALRLMVDDHRHLLDQQVNSYLAAA